jgi:hypothetical protein
MFKLLGGGGHTGPGLASQFEIAEEQLSEKLQSSIHL